MRGEVEARTDGRALRGEACRPVRARPPAFSRSVDLGEGLRLAELWLRLALKAHRGQAAANCAWVCTLAMISRMTSRVVSLSKIGDRPRRGGDHGLRGRPASCLRPGAGRSTRDLLNVLDEIGKIGKHGAGFKSLKDAWADTTTQASCCGDLRRVRRREG